ncbi:uncharacterized protein K460DRAFT_385882 [Cucurbitaria berberidis CBS 394.84]|uniref:Uncharacterized protein n=1 Tax=Cucurbitaria berberidis CBS 394.84 TaxID=1168544 RepID=A0A9P4GFX6_9PLEO|nr:uncharacterized protein K460DRAFT_385882 [Cucurbitaria berberidis CBS 394.84]KAF1845338.1 hypothetical protein K460DRAFT_385882 [Cucurbitaria berberidis CBS 394.84]
MLSLPLAKLSVAEDADPAKQKFTWKHEQHDLTFVLDSYGAHRASQLLKVVQGTQIRQVVELELLINEGDEMAQSMRDRGIELKAEQLPISAIVRCPLLAIRWKLPNKMVRRAQLKFRSSEDFDTAYNHLYQLGLRMSSSSESQAQTQSPTPSPERDSISQTKASSLAGAHLCQSASGALTCPPSRLSEISNRPCTTNNALTSLESQKQESAHLHPMSAYAGYITDPSTTGAYRDPLAPPVYFTRPTSATSDILGHTINNSVFPLQDRPMPTIEEFPRHSEARPETAMFYSRPNTAESILPPRRELPFPRLSFPLSSGSDSVRIASRPSTGLMGPPPLPARVASLRPSSSPSQHTELPPLPRPTVIDKSTPEMQATQQPPRTPNQEYATLMGTKIPPFEERENQHFLSSSPASSPLLVKRSSSNAHPSSRLLKTLSIPAQNARRIISQSTPTTPPTSGATYPSPIVSQGASGSANNHDDSLATYVMQADDDRRATLNEFIFRHLESDDFLTLVEDMETCWARVALGMQ